MLKLLIVDDEVLVRLALKSAVEWEMQGFELVGDASDGIQALELIDRYVPDIVLTDIFMPNMNGLELIKVVSQRYPHIKFVILSCHNEFEYVKEGMKLGAYDYILKLSMQPAELVKSLQELGKSIEEERKKTEGVINLKIQFNSNIKAIREKFFADILSNNIFNDVDYKEKVSYLHLKMINPNFIIVVMQIDDYFYLKDNNKFKSDKLLEFSIMNIIDEVASGYGMGEVFATGSGELVLVVSFEDSVSLIEANKKVGLIINEAVQMVKRMLNVTISSGVSNAVTNYCNIKHAYREAIEAIAYKFYMGKMSIAFYKGLKWKDDNAFAMDSGYKELLKNIEQLDFAAIKLGLDSLFKGLCNDKNINPIYVKKAIKELLFSLKKSGEQYGCDLDALAEKQDIYGEVDRSEDIDSLNSFFSNLVNKFIDEINNSRGKGCRQEINKVNDYIRVNFNKDITVAGMSKYVNMNPDYLSHLFKKEIGIGFVEYLMSIRMEKAKEYMRLSDLKVYEIAEKVGYNNFNYFSKLFKKEVGMTPMEYMKSVKV